MLDGLHCCAVLLLCRRRGMRVLRRLLRNVPIEWQYDSVGLRRYTNQRLDMIRQVILE